MIRSTFTVIGVFALLAGALTGCQQPKMDLAEMMKPPPRPAELDQLNPFVGTWEGTWEMSMKGAEKPLTGKGTDKFAWDVDKWVMTEHMEGTAENHKMLGTGLWIWDAQAKLFRYGSTDNYGMVVTGTGRYDAKTKTWHMKGTSQDTVRGQKSSGEGTLKMPDANTMEWSWAEWDALHLSKMMEMKGTSHRK
jgi:hypothetical protein